MRILLSTLAILALFACAEGPNAPTLPTSSVAKVSVNIETVVSETSITASISESRRGKWLTSAGLGVAVGNESLTIDRLDWFYYKGDGRLQLRRGGRGDFTDHWSKGEQGVRMILTISDTEVLLKPLATKAWWSNWSLDDHSQAGLLDGLDTGDTFTLKIEKCSYTNYGECEDPAAPPLVSLSDGQFKLTFADRDGIRAEADPTWFTFTSDYDGRKFGDVTTVGNTVSYAFDPALTTDSYVDLDCANGCYTFTDGSFSRSFRVSLGTKPASVYPIVPDTVEVVTPEPDPDPAVVQDAVSTGTSIYITFSETLDDEASVDKSHFNVVSGSNNDDAVYNRVKSVVVIGNVVLLTTAEATGTEEECRVSISYTGRGGLRDSNGQVVDSFRRLIDGCE